MAQRSSFSVPHTPSLQSDEIYRLLVDQVSDYAIFLLDPDGKVATWNPGAERLKGYRASEILGKPFSVFFTAADFARGKPENELRVARETGRFQDEGWRVRKDGSRFWASVVLTRINDAHGRLLGFGKITRDLTERRHTELRYRLLVEGVLDYAIYSMDAKGHITSWNLGGQRLKGYQAEEIIGKHFSTFYTAADRAAGMPERVLHTATAEGHFEGEGWRVRKDGTKFWASVVVTALRDDDGNLYGFSKVTRDITERKELLDALKRHSEELEQSNAELESFSYSVSHDLRAPLRAISGFAEALREDYGANLDERGHDFLNEISSAAVRMNSLVQDLLDYGRVSRVNMPLTAVNLRGSVDQAIRELGEHPGTLAVDVPPGLLVQGHQQILPQVVFNLLSNAFKFHAAGTTPSVRIDTQERNGTVRLNVRDNGIGIAPQHQERIWQVFERLHERDTYPGTGIGLAIVKRATARMNGRSGVESDTGCGATFWIELRAAEPAEEAKHE